MSKIDKYFGGIDYHIKYDFHNKQENVSNYVKYMLNRSLAMFHYVNLPDTIPQVELEKMLQCNGYVAIAEVNNSLYALNGGLGGEVDAYNRPTKINIVNPFLKFNKTLEIDKDCIIIPSDSMYMGLLPMYEKYCTMLNESDITMILATINKRIQILLSANDDNTVQSAKQFLSDIENGKLGVIAETKLFDSLKVNNSSNSSNVDLKDLFELHQYLKASMYNEIGLGANNNMKRERLAVAEVEVNSDNLYPLVDDMLNNRRISLEKVNNMFGTNIQVEFNSSWDYRVYNGEPVDTLIEDVTPSGEPTEDTTKEPTEDTTKDTTEETSEDTSEEPTEDTSEEPTEETSEEPTKDTTEETSEEPTEDTTEETSEEPTKDTTEETSEDTSEDTTEETSEDTSEEPTKDTTEETSEEPTEDTTEETSEEPTKDTTEETSEDTSEDTTEETSEEPTEDTSEEPTEEPTEDTTKDTTEDEKNNKKEMLNNDTKKDKKEH